MAINKQLQFHTIKPELKTILSELMNEPLFDDFVLVGGTNLSLRLGHRKSVDIDLFTDAEYGSIDFKELENYLQWRYPYYDTLSTSGPTAFGNTYYIGQDKDSSIKLDLMYTDAPFFEKHNINKGIRMATINQITAMKIEAINTGGRKKDWWDIHELLTIYTLDQMLSLHKRWEQWTHNREQLLDKLIIFNNADKEPDPMCLKGKNWDIIKMDIIKEVKKLTQLTQSFSPKP